MHAQLIAKSMMKAQNADMRRQDQELKKANEAKDLVKKMEAQSKLMSLKSQDLQDQMAILMPDLQSGLLRLRGLTPPPASSSSSSSSRGHLLLESPGAPLSPSRGASIDEISSLRGELGAQLEKLESLMVKNSEATHAQFVKLEGLMAENAEATHAQLEKLEGLMVKNAEVTPKVKRSPKKKAADVPEGIPNSKKASVDGDVV
jgi:small-conductance mechanosensitive channel